MSRELAAFKGFPDQILKSFLWRNSLWRFKGVVDEIVDGDTFYCTLDQAFRDYKYLSIRIKDIDTPELHKGTEASKAAGRAAKEYLESYLPPGTHIGAITYGEKVKNIEESFERYVAIVMVVRAERIVNVGDHLLELGYASKTEK